MGGGRKYVDLRYKFMRGLIHKERKQRNYHYLKSSAECTSRAIVSLELSEHPIKSINQAQKLQGIGGETKKKLEKILEEKAFSESPPVRGHFVSSAGALLLALSEEVEKALAEGHSQDRAVLVLEDKLRNRAKKLSEEPFLDDLNQTGFCQAWWRIEVLIKRDLVKRRTLNKEAVYQLLPLGQEAVRKIKEHFQYSAEDVYARSTDMQVTPARNLVKDSKKCITEISKCYDVQENFLYTNDKGSDGVVLQIDHREWGGDRVGLGELCALLDREGVVYRSCQLSAGDYSWVWRCDGTERCLPYLVERKRADDMARTLKEERFWPQINKMLEWKKDFDGRGIPGAAYYIVEGDPSSYVVKCADGCQGVGRCGYPSLAQVKCAFRDLSLVSELIVQTTDDIQGTMATISSITVELQQRVKKGEFDQIIAMELDEGSLAQEDVSDVVINLDSDDSNYVTDKSLKTQSKVECVLHQDHYSSVTTSTSLQKQNRIHDPDSRRKVSIDKFSPQHIGTLDNQRSRSGVANVCNTNIRNCDPPNTNSEVDNKLPVCGNDDLDQILRSNGKDSEDWKYTAKDSKYNRILHESHTNVESLYGERKLYANQVSESEKINLNQSNLPLEPLVQYHCSDTYTGPSPSKKWRPSPGTEYRPKITPQSSTQNKIGELLSHDTGREFDQNQTPVWRPKVQAKKTLNLTPHHSFVEPVTKQTSQRSRSSTGKVYLMKSVKHRSGVNTDSSDSCDSTDFPLKKMSKETNQSNSEYMSRSESAVVKSSRPVINTMGLKTSKKCSSRTCELGNSDEQSRNSCYDYNVNSPKKLPHGRARVSLTSPSSGVNPLLGFGLCPSDVKAVDSAVMLRKSSRSKRPVKRYIKEYDVVDSDSDSQPEPEVLNKESQDSEDSLPDLEWVPPKTSKYSLLSSSSDDDQEDGWVEEKSKKSNVLHCNPGKFPSFKRNFTVTSGGGHNSTSVQVDHQSKSESDNCRFMRKERIMGEKIETVFSILPHLSRSDIATALKQHGSNVELCIASLLDENSQEENSTLIDLTG